VAASHAVLFRELPFPQFYFRDHRPSTGTVQLPEGTEIGSPATTLHSTLRLIGPDRDGKDGLRFAIREAAGPLAQAVVPRSTK